MAERRSSLKAPTPVRTALLRCMCCVKNGEVEKLREENRQLRAEVRFQHAKQGDAVDTRRGVASLSMALDMAPPEVPPMVAPSPPSRYFGTAVALVAVGCLAALAVAATDMQVHPLVLIGASALLGAGVLVALLPPAPPPPPVPPSASKARRKRHISMRRISAEVVEGMAYRAASIVVDDGTKRSLPEVVMSRVTEGALTDEVVQCKLDSTQAPSKRLSVTRLTRRSMTRVSTEALPPGAQHFVGEWTFVEQEHYDDFLREAVGMPWAIRRIAMHIVPTPAFAIKHGVLHCTTTCLGAKPVLETLEAGESVWFEPNLNVEYTVTGHWEGDAYVNVRSAAKINAGKPTKQVRRVDEAGELVIEQDWGGKHKFTSRFTKKPPTEEES